MADALVSAVLKQLVALAFQQMKREWSRVSGIEENVKSVTRNLEDIQVVLLDADRKQITDGSVKRWLDKLKAVSYELDTVLDEWKAATILRSNLKLPRKVWLFIDPYFQRKQVQRRGLRRRTACKIEKLNKELDKISNEKQRYTFATQNFSIDTFGMTAYSIEYERRPNTTSFVDASKVSGRKTETKNLVTKLLSKNDQAATRRVPDIIPIVGMGGIGKTTLAKLAYNNEEVDAHFSLKIWVCVSDPFDEIRIARAIGEALKVKDVHKLVEFQALLDSIHESVKDKRFLLVLDDVWSEDYNKWEQLERALGSTGAPGSKILVTTRKKEVAIMMKSETHIIPIGCLADEDCLEIFRKLAFLDREESEQFKKIEKEIAQECKGLPLVAKALGSLMRFKKFDIEHWEEVLKNDLWKGDQFENKVYVPFLLSYFDLPPLEKCCLLYCSYFPKDYILDRDELIELWMSQGYLSSTKRDERKGIDCFENLAKRSFFQDFETDEDENIIRCKMHDIVHDFVLLLAKNEYLNTVVKTKEDEIELLQAKAFHCTLAIESETREIPSTIYSKRNLHTLSVGNLSSISWDLLLKLTSLRTLNLSHCSFSGIPEGIDKLILLRYLNLSQNRWLKKLPKTLGNLFNLQTLKLEGCEVELPKEIEKLANLRHLYLGKLGEVQCPKELGKLTGLQTLDFFHVISSHNGENMKLMKLEDLKELNHLKGGLHISGIGWTKDVHQAERAQLNNKEGLVAVELEFHGTDRRRYGRDQNCLLLEGLLPHPNLKHLKISCYYGIEVFPRWLTSLVHLKRLVLRSCSKCQTLGPFGKLPSLESLSFQEMFEVKRVGQKFLGIEETRNIEKGSIISLFPKLKRLEFRDLRKWYEWESFASSDGLSIMPSLVSLEILGCSALKAPLPGFLRKTPVKKLTIKNCRLLEQHFQETEDTVKILTLLTLEFIDADTAGSSDVAEAKICKDDPRTLEHGEISSAGDKENDCGTTRKISANICQDNLVLVDGTSQKEKRVTTNSQKKVSLPSDQNAESVDGVVSVVEENKPCPHLDKGVDFDKPSAKIGSSEHLRCEDCREGAADRRVGKGKGKQETKTEENDENKDVFSDVVNVEDVRFGTGSVTTEIKSVAVSGNLDGQGGYSARGLDNLGNTCFFNSVLQNLLAINKFRDYFLKLDVSVGPLTMALKKIYAETKPEAGLKNVINPTSFFRSICAKAPQFKGSQQHDSHELLRFLLDGLSSEELGARKQSNFSKDYGHSYSPGPTFVDTIFGGQVSSTVCCVKCGHSSTVYEPFLDLSLPVPTKKPTGKKAQQSLVEFVVGEASSSVLGGGQDDFDGFGGLFDEPEVSTGHSAGPSLVNDVTETGFVAGNSSESETIETCLETCLAHYTKQELLSNENAWHCENCSKALAGQKLEANKQLKAASKALVDKETRIQSDLEYSNKDPCPTEVRKDEDNVQSGAGLNKLDATRDCSSHYHTAKENDQTDELTSLVSQGAEGKVVMKDAVQEQSDSSGLYHTCRQESLVDHAIDSCCFDEPSSAGSINNRVQQAESKLSTPNPEPDEKEAGEINSETVEVKRDATKRLLINKAPPILTIHLKRFNQDARGHLRKLNGHVTFREMIDLEPYMYASCKDKERSNYRLIGVVEHSGSMSGGHYVAYVRGGENSRGKAGKENQGSVWFYTSDAYVSETSLDEVLGCEAYILFYEKL